VNVPEGSLLDLHRKKADTSDLLVKAKAATPTSAQKRAVAKEKKAYQNGEGIEMIWVEPGTFQMGSQEDEEGRFNYETRHKVTLTQGFWLAKTELTQAQWKAVMGNNPSTYASSGLQAPVENISWEEAIDYCRRLTDLERARGVIPPGWEYTLPTEAQWEYACRAGSETGYSFGNDPAELHKYGNYNDLSGNFVGNDAAHDDGNKFTALVGSYLPNEWGFHDMHGNVAEWCRDIIDPSGPDYSEFGVVDPLGAFGSLSVFRGGGFNGPMQSCRSAFRIAVPPKSLSHNIGFRPALSPPMKQP
jgi:formylglycine-generating enzyme required for sulfatase activity